MVVWKMKCHCVLFLCFKKYKVCLALLLFIKNQQSAQMLLRLLCHYNHYLPIIQSFSINLNPLLNLNTCALRRSFSLSNASLLRRELRSDL